MAGVLHPHGPVSLAQRLPLARGFLVRVTVGSWRAGDSRWVFGVRFRPRARSTSAVEHITLCRLRRSAGLARSAATIHVALVGHPLGRHQGKGRQVNSVPHLRSHCRVYPFAPTWMWKRLMKCTDEAYMMGIIRT